MNRLAVQFLMVLKESPGLMAAIEHGPTHSLAAELLGVDTRGVGGNPQGALVVEACGLGDHPPRTEPNRQVIPPLPSLFTLLRPYLAQFFPVSPRFCAFSLPRRHGSNEPQAGTQGQETAARAPRAENSALRRATETPSRAGSDVAETFYNSIAIINAKQGRI